jgi:hypothetical protein
MMMDRTPLPEVAKVMGVEERELRARLRTILGKLRVPTPKVTL